jgi:hypothetical protein
MPLFVLGRKLEDLFPVAFLPEHHALAVAIMSYNGGIDYGLLGDFDALPDIDVIAEGIEAALAELLAAARKKPARTATSNGRKAKPAGGTANGGPSAILPAGSGRAKSGPAADMRAKRTRGARSPRKPADG